MIYICKESVLNLWRWWKDLEPYEIIEQMQGINIVRCKECKHNDDGVCEYAEWVCKADDFCSYGERKESE